MKVDRHWVGPEISR